ncbi:MAG TPA: NAD(P) transhydrogenase subunit alpha [Planctomycetaceae bacterium]|jgi:NAD(P) transhydrogenase subunit alpha|nr:NAD(P) transhydrogenase subunit alpha [Planctomycetaceae bacterium]
MLGLLLAFAGLGSLSAGGLSAEPAVPVPIVLAATGGDVVAAKSETSTPSADTSEENAASIDLWSMLFVFVLSSFIGIGVIGRVSRLLHTPLMSLTNAISAIAIVGSIMVTGSNYPEPIRILGAIALFASMTNIVSGFLITDRMLKMFRQARSSAPGNRDASPSNGSSPTVSPAS